ncbi:helix-turn-helix domain-containing protein [Deltaproteobacteria bacterium OttesenSCG-928-M10]|nr:helix-turn-helix domain-containing protein [Deltaproteobacteria bacterium OttesenSCG-928-M10]MDL2259442.1 helix-turn-helix domain-containing protein [Deltaproteobacteria bacterium OttesenSCG-928-K17]
MLSIDEILKKTGLTRYNFQAWRRNGQQLLPKPVSIDKRNILFDDSILERIRFIREQQAAGRTLAEIEEMILKQKEEDQKTLPSWEVMAADQEDFMDEVKAFREKWERGQCQEEVCAALKLDPPLSGTPVVFCLPAVCRPAGGLMVYVTVISHSVTHFAEMYVDLYDEPVVKRREEIPAADFGMLLCIIAREFSERRHVLKTEMIPYLLFHGFEGTGADADYWMQSIEVAKILNQINEASRQYLIRLKSGDIKIP